MPPPTMAEILEADILIGVIGVTGAGKTTFISKATGRTDLEIGHGIESCTQEIKLVSFMLDGKKVVLIDTPGFDDTHTPDTEMLKLIANYLTTNTGAATATSSSPSVPLLHGLIFLQPITANRLQGSEKKRTRLFKSIMGPDAYSRCIIASTMWDELPPSPPPPYQSPSAAGGAATTTSSSSSSSPPLSVGEARVLARLQSADAWKDMVAQGSRHVRHENTVESALKIVRIIMNLPREGQSGGPKPLLLQKQLMKDGGGVGSVAETDAGKVLIEDLRGKVDSLEKEIKELRQDKQATLEEMKELREQMRAVKEMRKGLDKPPAQQQRGSCVIL